MRSLWSSVLRGRCKALGCSSRKYPRLCGQFQLVLMPVVFSSSFGEATKARTCLPVEPASGIAARSLECGLQTGESQDCRWAKRVDAGEVCCPMKELVDVFANKCMWMSLNGQLSYLEIVLPRFSVRICCSLGRRNIKTFLQLFSFFSS